jgi:hypothetical protein
MSNLDFLSNVTLETVKVETKKVSTDKLPIKADIRVFANGKVYPSIAFAAKHALDFVPRVNVAEEGQPENLVLVGNGLDIFRSSDWGMIADKLPKEILFVAVVPKAEPKVDMWGSCKYDKDTGEPKSSILTQGSNTFAKTVLVGYLENVLGVVWEAVEYVDLVVVTEHTMTSSNNVYHLPKTVSTGTRKGEADSVRRENLSIHPLVLAPKEVEVLDADKVVDTDANSTQGSVTKADTDEESDPQAEAPQGNGPDWAEKLQKTSE